ncbi:MAG: carbonic anhydrase [Candidatus Eremiobacteraeota bacterium]|nr:carbonic anhydrase [Candidatus Eremiobacteraeota bacterium]
MSETRTRHLDALLAGNARFSKGSAAITAAKLALGQTPFAVVLACSDSRVPVEIIFDRGPGELFVIRNAGNIVSDESLGSIEYAVDVLRTPLIVVLGHSGCGAVAAAIERVRNGATFPGHISTLVAAIVPAAAAVRNGDGDWHARAVAANIRASVDTIVRRSTIVERAVREGGATIAGAVYDLHTCAVSLLP